MILNCQKKSVDYERTNERGEVINFGSNFDQRAPSTQKYVRRSSRKLFFLTTVNRDPLKLCMNFRCLRSPYLRAGQKIWIFFQKVEVFGTILLNKWKSGVCLNCTL
jgi:hypothetical protein